MHDTFVTLKKRFEDGHKRYATQYKEKGLNEEERNKRDEYYFALEKELNNLDGNFPRHLEFKNRLEKVRNGNKDE